MLFRALARRFIGALTLLFVVGCMGRVDSLDFQATIGSADVPSTARAAIAISPAPRFSLLDAVSGKATSAATDSLAVAAFSDSSCMTPAAGALATATNPLGTTSGSATFEGLSYSPADHREEGIYLGASALKSKATACVGPIDVVQTFVTGSGFSVFQHGNTGAAGASNISRWDVNFNMAIDDQGRYVIAGQSTNTAGGKEMAIWRIHPDGTFDTSFGGSGVVLFQHNGLGAAGAANDVKEDYGRTLRIDSQGRYVIGGYSRGEPASIAIELVIWRYLSDGTLDPTFTDGSTTGYIVFRHNLSGTAGVGLSAKYDVALDLRIDSQGRYVLGGLSKNSAGGRELAIWRFNPSGTLDTTFTDGVTSGFVLFQAGLTGAAGAANATKQDWPYAGLIIDSQGRYVLAGMSLNASGRKEAVMWRYLPDGTRDPAFGSGGYAVFNNNLSGAAGANAGAKLDYFAALAEDASGNYVSVGVSYDSHATPQGVLWRYLANGTIDPTLGAGNGFVVLLPRSWGYQGPTLQIDASGKYVVVGAKAGSGGGTELALGRYNPDGTLDSAFAGGIGYAVFRSGEAGAAGASGTSRADTPIAVLIDRRQRLVVSGYTTNEVGGKELVLMRYTSAGELDK